jgi:multidrug resistance efflux pump
MGFHTPFSVLVIGGIVGIFVFAASSAFTVWFKRNQSASEPQEQTASLSATLLKLALSGGVVLAIIFGLNAVQPRTFLEQEGLLLGKDLFTIRSRAGFTAEYPPLDRESTATTEYVEQGKVLVSFRPNPDPKEIAAASRQRDILQEQLNLERTRRPPADPALQNQLESLERRLDIQNQRQKELINQRESYLREETKTNAASSSEYRQIEKQAITVDSEYKQTAVSLQTAEMEMRSASELLQRNLISQHEKNSRIAAYNVLRSKFDELRERARLLEQEKAAIRASLSEARQRTREQLANVERWLTEVTAIKQQIAAERDEASKRLQEEGAHGNERHSSRIRQLELQLAEVSALLPNLELPARVEVTAPWSGYVGYRDLSPATLRPDTGPLVVMYKPDHIWVELQAPNDPARDLTGGNTRIKLFVHGASNAQVAFSGHLERKLPLPDGKTVTLRVSTAPPASLVRKLALGEEVQAYVNISSKGFSIASVFEKIPAFLHANHSSLLYAGVSFVSIIVPVCFFTAIIIARSHRGASAKETLTSASKNNSLAVSKNDDLVTHISLYTHAHTNESKLPNLQYQKDFIYDFTNGDSENLSGQPDIRHRESSLPIADTVSVQLERIIGQHQDIAPITQVITDRQKQPSINSHTDHMVHTWQVLGKCLSQSIITGDVDISLLNILHGRLEQHGVWATPFIASALSRDIYDDMLLTYGLNLCVKRLSEVQHRAELEPAICDLTRDLCILQRFFPILFKKIVPNLQQGLTAALYVVMTEVEAETEEDNLLAMLRQVLADISTKRPERHLDVE